MKREKKGAENSTKIFTQMLKIPSLHLHALHWFFFLKVIEDDNGLKSPGLAFYGMNERVKTISSGKRKMKEVLCFICKNAKMSLLF